MRVACVAIAILASGCGAGPASDEEAVTGPAEIAGADDRLSGDSSAGGVDTTVFNDGDALPSGAIDVGQSGCDVVPFDELCPCATDGDCRFGPCAPTPFGGVCPPNPHCMDQCREHWTCRILRSRVDFMPTCVHTADRLCAPCVDDAECASSGSTSLDHTGDNRCHDRSDGSRRCGTACLEPYACPPRFDCVFDDGPLGQCWAHLKDTVPGAECSGPMQCPEGEWCVWQHGDATARCRMRSDVACPPRADTDVLIVP